MTALSIAGIFTLSSISLRRLEICDTAQVSLNGQTRVSLGDLVIHDGNRLTLPSTVGDFSITNSLSLEDGAKIALAANPLGDWTASTGGESSAPVALAVFGPNVARPSAPSGYEEVFDMPKASNAGGGVLFATLHRIVRTAS